MAYITEAELAQYGVNERVLRDFSSAQITSAIDAASSEADSYLSAGYEVPLTTYPIALKLHVARATVYHLFTVRGPSPTGSDQVITDNYDRAIRYYRDLQKNLVNIPDTETEPDREENVVVYTTTKRGW